MNPAFFTRPRYRVPHGRIGRRKVIVAHLAVIRAFEIIRAEATPLGNELEDDITIKLENVLSNQILNRGAVEGFDKSYFAKVRRVIVVNFDGTKKSKKPDLCFELKREHRTDWDQLQDALFAECKPVDKKHPLSGHYCAVSKDCTGIERFVIGDYAWAMQEALMIGYVRDSFKIKPHLNDQLAGRSPRYAGLGSPEPLEAACNVEDDSGPEPLYRTRHQRLFTWKENGQPATPIMLYHSWHDCN